MTKGIGYPISKEERRNRSRLSQPLRGILEDNKMTDETISVQDLNEVFEMYLGQGWQRSMNDNRGCSMGRGGGQWLSPQTVTSIVSDILDALGVDIEPISIPDMRRAVRKHYQEEEYDPEEIAAVAKMSDDEVKTAYENINN